MTEWVVLQVLLHHRQQRVYDRFQREQALGGASAAAGKRGARRRHGPRRPRPRRGGGSRSVSASRSPAGAGGRSALPGIESFHGAAGLDRVPGADRHPRLPASADAGDARHPRAAALPKARPRRRARRGPILINAGRGGLQVEADIVAALDEGRPRRREPRRLREGAARSGRARSGVSTNVVITPHCAASSSADELVDLVLGQIAAYEAGKPLRHVVDRASLY